MSEHAEQPAPAAPPPSREQLLLEAAAGLIDKRVVALRCGTPPLHATLELEAAARAIRILANELNRLQEANRAGREGRLPPAPPCSPPVLQRGSRSAA